MPRSSRRRQIHSGSAGAATAAVLPGGAAADLVDGVVGAFDDVEAVHDQPRVRERGGGRLRVGGGHVDCDVGDAGAQARRLATQSVTVFVSRPLTCANRP